MISACLQCGSMFQYKVKTNRRMLCKKCADLRQRKYFPVIDKKEKKEVEFDMKKVFKWDEVSVYV